MKGTDMTTKEIGDFGEDAACGFLTDKDYEIVKRNFRMKTGEIDIIAKKGDCTVFVEVKTRKNNLYGEPSEYVDSRKIARIRRTALIFAGSLDINMRFDVIEIIYTADKGRLEVKKINHIEDAF